MRDHGHRPLPVFRYRLQFLLPLIAHRAGGLLRIVVLAPGDDLAVAEAEDPDVTVAVRGRYVQISGVRKDTTIEEGATYYSMEISYSRFERTIEMPADLENSKMTIEARDGILLVRLVANERVIE